MGARTCPYTGAYTRTYYSASHKLCRAAMGPILNHGSWHPPSPPDVDEGNWWLSSDPKRLLTSILAPGGRSLADLASVRENSRRVVSNGCPGSWGVRQFGAEPLAGIAILTVIGAVAVWVRPVGRTQIDTSVLLARNAPRWRYVRGDRYRLKALDRRMSTSSTARRWKGSCRPTVPISWASR